MYNQKPLLGTPINWAHPLSKGLVGAWLFNENSGDKVFDLSGNGNHGVFGTGERAPSWMPEGLYFDGSDYVSLSSCPLTFPQSSVCMWIKLDNLDVGSGGTSQTFSNFYIDTNNVVRIGHDEGSAGRIFVSYKYLGSNYGRQTDGGEITANTWHHIAYTFNGPNLDIFVDGIKSDTGDNAWSTGVINIIGGKAITAGNMNGTIKSIWVYERGLNAREIWQLYVDPYCWLAQPMGAELMYAAPPIGAIMNQFQRADLGADLYDGVLIT